MLYVWGMADLIRVRCIVPHDRLQRFQIYDLADTDDVTMRIQRGYLEYLQYVADPNGEEEE